MPSGGKQKGAGRPPVPFLRKLQVGMFCQERLPRARGPTVGPVRGPQRYSSAASCKSKPDCRGRAGRFVTLPPAELRKAIAKQATELDKIGRVSAVPEFERRVSGGEYAGSGRQIRY